ncbi:hypothetical protein VNI00_013997 [Paramarasmius palmivorus]|uniref:Uncharacterized protein n=1 Tax=Paramarasmius palmivorus TaxID=297713 RepID=A0AAW0BVY2_9AGAR
MPPSEYKIRFQEGIDGCVPEPLEITTITRPKNADTLTVAVTYLFRPTDDNSHLAPVKKHLKQDEYVGNLVDELVANRDPGFIDTGDNNISIEWQNNGSEWYEISSTGGSSEVKETVGVTRTTQRSVDIVRELVSKAVPEPEYLITLRRGIQGGIGMPIADYVAMVLIGLANLGKPEEKLLKRDEDVDRLLKEIHDTLHLIPSEQPRGGYDIYGMNLGIYWKSHDLKWVNSGEQYGLPPELAPQEDRDKFKSAVDNVRELVRKADLVMPE